MKFAKWPERLVVSLIRGYQQAISPWLGQRCRFTPSCSQYAIEAVQTQGMLRGLALAARRLARCHPFNPGGYDPVDKKTAAPKCRCAHH
jgi:uncharacterized protein